MNVNNNVMVMLLFGFDQEQKEKKKKKNEIYFYNQNFEMFLNVNQYFGEVSMRMNFVRLSIKMLPRRHSKL